MMDRPIRFISRNLAWQAPAMLACLLSLGWGGIVLAADEPAPGSREAGGTAEWLKVADEKGKSIGLQVAMCDFLRPDGTGPRVTLVGMAHIGEASFYAEAQKMLEDYDVVLYESVKPPGAGGAGGETDEQRVQSTEAALNFTAGLIELYGDHHARYPDDLAELRSFISRTDPRMPQFMDAALVDAWGRKFHYERCGQSASDQTGEGEPRPTPRDAESYWLYSFGADGRKGGEGINADLTPDRAVPALELAADDGLQGQLATALRLEFQLDALDYSKPNWRCSDMSMDQVARGLAEYGIDFGPMSGALAGTSLPAQLVKAVLAVLRIADSFVGGAIVDTFKVVMIEMLSNESLMDQSIDMYGKGFAEVIIDGRNQVVIDDLKKLITDEPDVKSVAILYGAAHLPDLAERLHEQLSYDQGDGRWLTAIEVDLTESAVTQRDIQQIRSMMKWMMAQQLPQGKKNQE